MFRCPAPSRSPISSCEIGAKQAPSWITGVCAASATKGSKDLSLELLRRSTKPPPNLGESNTLGWSRGDLHPLLVFFLEAMICKVCCVLLPTSPLLPGSRGKLVVPCRNAGKQPRKIGRFLHQFCGNTLRTTRTYPAHR